MKTYNVSSLPSMITLGYDGENNWRPNRFDCSSLLTNHPNGIISLWLLPKGETQAYPVALDRDGNTVVWTPLSEEMSAATGAFQLVCIDGTDVGKSEVVMFRVGESVVPGADHPAETPSWATQTIERAESAADRAEEAADSIDLEHLEQIVGVAVEAYLVEHPVEAPVQSVNGKTGAVVLGASDVGALPDTYVAPVQSVNGKTGAVNLSASDVHALPDSYTPPVESVNGKTGAVVLDANDVGALPDDTPIPAAVTEQTVAGWGFTKNTGTYSKPSGGIPKTDLASDVQTSLGKADTALQQHQSLAAYRTSAAQDTIDAAQDTAIAAKYTKPSTGIPKSDLASDVQTSLGKADTALQQHQSLSAYRTASAQDTIDDAQNVEIAKKANIADLAAVATSGSYNDLTDKPTIPSLTGYATQAWVNNKGYLTLADLPVYNGGVS